MACVVHLNQSFYYYSSSASTSPAQSPSSSTSSPTSPSPSITIIIFLWKLMFPSVCLSMNIFFSIYFINFMMFSFNYAFMYTHNAKWQIRSDTRMKVVNVIGCCMLFQLKSLFHLSIYIDFHLYLFQENMYLRNLFFLEDYRFERGGKLVDDIPMTWQITINEMKHKVKSNFLDFNKSSLKEFSSPFGWWAYMERSRK